MNLLITLLVLVIIFSLLYWLIGIIPLPPPMANTRWVLYALLIIVAIIVLLNFVPGIHL